MVALDAATMFHLSRWKVGYEFSCLETGLLGVVQLGSYVNMHLLVV